jgi:hypothetical protein
MLGMMRLVSGSVEVMVPSTQFGSSMQQILQFLDGVANFAEPHF